MFTKDFHAHLLEFLKNSQDVFWIRDIADGQLYVNLAYEKVWGLSCEDLYKNPSLWIENIHPCDKDSVKKNIYPQINSNNSISKKHSYRIIKPDGSIRWIEECVFSLEREGKIISIGGIARDSTEHKTKEQDLLSIIKDTDRANKNITNDLPNLNISDSFGISVNQVLSSSFFIQLAEKSDDVFWVRNADYSIQVYLSPAYEKIWGSLKQEIYDHPNKWEDFLHPEDRLTVQNSLNERNPGTDKEKKFSLTYRIIRPDGETRWIRDTSFPIDDITGKCIGFAGIAKDITQDYIREQALVEAKEHAETLNQAKSDFLAVMSHELRTPLNGILGIAQILKRQVSSTEHNEYVGHILDAGFHLLSLLNDILDFSKLEANKTTLCLAPLNLKELLQEVVSIMTPQAILKKLEIGFEYKQSGPENISGDAKAIRQVITNLVGNAIKFTEKGRVTIKIDNTPIHPSKAHFIISVSDTGLGIPKDKLETIFDRFQQVDSSESRKYGGTGLGLAISKSLIELMGGTVQVESNLGEGSRFIWEVDFELADQLSKAEKDLSTTTNNANLGLQKPLVLVVEDNPLNQKIAELMLQDLGCNVHLMDNGKQVLDSNLSIYDLIFMDVGLPEMSGNEIVEIIRANKHYANLPIIALTAHAYEKNKVECLAAGMNDIINKPVIQKDMANVLKKWLNTTLKQKEPLK